MNHSINVTDCTHMVERRILEDANLLMYIQILRCSLWIDM